MLIVIGASTGGLEAMIRLLGGLPHDFCLPMVFVLHQRANRESGVPEMLARYTHLKVVEPEDKQMIRSGHLYVAPPNYHLLVERDGSFSLSVDAPLHYSRPSIDMLFESAAEALGDKVVACVLSGANRDGSVGAAAIKAHGGLVFVQDPTTAVAASMPEAAQGKVAVDAVMPAERIGNLLGELQAQGRVW